MFESSADSTRELGLPKSWGNGGHSSLLPPHRPDKEEQKEQGPMETYLKTDMPLKFAA